MRAEEEPKGPEHQDGHQDSAQPPEAGAELAEQDITAGERRGDQAVPGLPGALGAERLEGDSGGSECDHEQDRTGNEAQKDVEVGSGCIDRDARAGLVEEEPDDEVELGFLCECGRGGVAVMPELDEGPPGEEKGEVGERAIERSHDAEAHELAEQSGAGGKASSTLEDTGSSPTGGRGRKRHAGGAKRRIKLRPSPSTLVRKALRSRAIDAARKTALAASWRPHIRETAEESTRGLTPPMNRGSRLMGLLERIHALIVTRKSGGRKPIRERSGVIPKSIGTTSQAMTASTAMLDARRPSGAPLETQSAKERMKNAVERIPA